MPPSQKVVCVKQVKQETAEEWDETMPLPGDIIEGVGEDSADESFVSAKARADLNSHLGRIHRVAGEVWLKVRRGEGTIKLRVCVVPIVNGKLQKKFTVRAASDERHVAVLAEMTFQECFDLQGTFSICYFYVEKCSNLCQFLFCPSTRNRLIHFLLLLVMNLIFQIIFTYFIIKLIYNGMIQIS